AKLVIAFAFFRVRKDVVGLVDFLELLLGGLVAGVQVRMVFFGQLAVGAFDLGLGGIFADPQHLVIITFFCHRINPLYTSAAHGVPFRRAYGSVFFILTPQGPPPVLPGGGLFMGYPKLLCFTDQTSWKSAS